MNAATRAELDVVPIPVEDGAPVRCMAVLRDRQWRTAWAMSGGRRPEPFGEPYPNAKAAADASGHINERGLA